MASTRPTALANIAPVDSAARPFSISDVILYAIGVAGLAACLTVVFLAMRAVMDIGDFCAEGGPYEIRQHCPEGVPLLMVLGIFGLFGFGGLMAWKGSVIGGVYGALVLLAWPALFISLGFNFLQYAFDPPGADQGIVWGWLIPGVLFMIMGAGPLLALIPSRGAGSTDDPAQLRRSRSRLLNTVVARAEQRGWTVTGSQSAVSRSEVFVAQLERLAKLRNDGSLTELEYEQAKRALLDAQGQT